MNARARKIQEARERLLQATTIQGGRRKFGRRIPRARYPKIIEATYAKDLVALLRTHIREAFAPLIAELPDILETAARERDRIDYDPDQPRAEDGRFGETAGDKKAGDGGDKKAGDGPAKPARKGVPEILNRAARPGWLRNDRPIATAMKALADRDAGMDMVRARAQLETMHLQAGLGERPTEASKVTRIDESLDTIGADGVREPDGKIGLSPESAARLEKFAQRWATDPEGTRAKLEAIPKAFNSATAVEEGLKEGSETRALIDEVYGMHVLVHESLHGFGPIDQQDKEGSTIFLEEVTTEMATRGMIRDNFGFDLHEVRDEVIGNGNGKRIPAPYQDQIHTTMRAIAEVYKLPPDAAQHVLEAASVEFKRQELPSGPPWHIIESRLSSAVYEAKNAPGYGADKAPAIRAAQAALDAHRAAKPPRPIERFARTLDAVLTRGPDGTGAVDVSKSSDKAVAFDKLFRNMFTKYL